MVTADSMRRRLFFLLRTFLSDAEIAAVFFIDEGVIAGSYFFAQFFLHVSDLTVIICVFLPDRFRRIVFFISLLQTLILRCMSVSVLLSGRCHRKTVLERRLDLATIHLQLIVNPGNI